MYLARFLNKLIKEDGFVLIDANSVKYIIGNPKKEKPIILRLLDKKLHYKLLFYHISSSVTVVGFQPSASDL